MEKKFITFLLLYFLYKNPDKSMAWDEYLLKKEKTL